MSYRNPDTALPGGPSVHGNPELTLGEYTLCPARMADEPAIWHIIHTAALDMVARGRRQWDDGYPPRTAIAADMQAGHGYVLRGHGSVVGYMALTFDGEPAYDHLQGQWLTHQPYATVHRTAIALPHRGRGLSRSLLGGAERLCRERHVGSIRIDTNYDNVEMLGLVGSLGYVRCGLCHYDHHGNRVERIAFEKVL